MAQFDDLFSDPITALGYGILSNPSNIMQGAAAGMKMAQQSKVDAEDRELKRKLLEYRLSQGVEQPSSVREYEYFNALGDDEKRQYLQMKRANPFVDIGGEVARFDPLTNQPMVNIPKVPTLPEQNKLKKTAAEEKKLASYQIGENQTTIDKIDELLNNKKGLDAITGLSSYLPNVSESARNAQADLDTLKSRSAFAGLQEMRANSPTGGALGGIAVQELDMLKSAEASLQEAQSPEEFEKALRNYKSALSLANKTVRESYQSVYGEDLPPTGVVGDSTSVVGKYNIGDIIETGGKRYRVIGGDPNDPDVESVQ